MSEFAKRLYNKNQRNDTTSQNKLIWTCSPYHACTTHHHCTIFLQGI